MRFKLFHHKNRTLANYVKEFSSLKMLESRGQWEVEVLSLPQQN
ncbi:unnamed protein product, partial [marine sediment metagenome]